MAKNSLKTECNDLQEVYWLSEIYINIVIIFYHCNFYLFVVDLQFLETF